MALQFITADDLNQAIRDRHEQQILDGNLALWDGAEAAAIERCSSALRQANYNVQAAFSATGNNRNHYLVTVVCDIAIYMVCKRAPQKFIPQERKDAYNEALNWLERVADGKESPTLPKVTVTDANGNTAAQSSRRMGSEPKLPWRY